MNTNQFSRRLMALSVLMIICVMAWRYQGASPALAQGINCPDLVKKALDSAGKVCAGTQRNQACYGNVQAAATPKGGATFVFGKPGDIVNLKDVQTLKMAAYDPNGGTWGVALMRVQANLPDTAPGQNVTMIVFGDAVVTDASKPGDGNKPMQAFHLTTGVGSPGCKQVSQDGLLLKSPEGDQKVALTVDGVQLSVGSTVFISAKPTGAVATPDKTKKTPAIRVQVHTIKGSVDITANGKTKSIEAGMTSETDVDEEFDPIDQPSDPVHDELLDDPQFGDILPVDMLDQEDQTFSQEAATPEAGQENPEATPENGTGGGTEPTPENGNGSGGGEPAPDTGSSG